MLSSPRRRLRRVGACLVAATLSVIAGACRDQPRADPEREARRVEAGHHLCVAEELVADARDRAAALRLADDAGAATLPALEAAGSFARAYLEHAEVRYAQAVYADSLVGASTRADSTRLAERARGFALAPPSAGTLEEAVASAYARDFTARLRNAAHACNQSIGSNP